MSTDDPRPGRRPRGLPPSEFFPEMIRDQRERMRQVARYHGHYVRVNWSESGLASGAETWYGQVAWVGRPPIRHVPRLQPESIQSQGGRASGVPILILSRWIHIERAGWRYSGHAARIPISKIFRISLWHPEGPAPVPPADPPPGWPRGPR